MAEEHVEEHVEEQLVANQKMIEWLLFKTGIKLSVISRKTGVSESALGNLRRKDSRIQDMRFQNAAALTKFAEEMKKQMEL